MLTEYIQMAGLTIFAAILTANTNAAEIQFDAGLPEFSPVRDVAPVYPQRAIDRKISGYTLVEYSISANGRVADAKVVDSEPEAVFDKAAKRAISRTTYDEADAANVQGDKFYRLYVFELDDTNANQLAIRD